MKIALLDYGMGNLGSVLKALGAVGADAETVSRGDALERFSRCILPGVGNFGDCMENLRSRGLDAAIRRFIARGGELFGICLGMQMLLEWSEEAPGVPGLGIFPGTVRRFPAGSEKVPHVGWNAVRFMNQPLFAGLGDEAYFYFVHSYFVAPETPGSAALSHYIVDFCPVLHRKNVTAVQFHPEKSQRAGLTLLGNFVNAPVAGR